MSLESRIEAGGRRALSSPLWVGLAITAFLVIPTFLVPSIPLWIALVSLVTLTPLVLLGTYAVYHGYWWASGATEKNAAEAKASESEIDSPIAQLRHRYATGEIDGGDVRAKARQASRNRIARNKCDGRAHPPCTHRVRRAQRVVPTLLFSNEGMATSSLSI